MSANARTGQLKQKGLMVQLPYLQPFEDVNKRVWAYERSCQRYLAIAQTMVEPDPLKIKYREALIQAVQTIVKELRPPTSAVTAEVAQDFAAEADHAAFRDLLTAALQQLHEGSIARYRLRRLEYIAWQHPQARA